MFKKLNWLIIFILLIAISTSCRNKQSVLPIKIAISKAAGSEHYDAYPKWLKDCNNNIECINLYTLEPQNALKMLDSCSGIVLTGGPDVDPGRYGKEFDTARCEMDLRRDTLEFALIKKALELKIPVLGICRGEQIFNVALGGSLIVDLPQDHPSSVSHQNQDADKCFHEIEVNKSSVLYEICGTGSGTVNSNHHQAVDKISDELIATAYSKDSIIEGYQWKNPEGKSFLLTVQWHPERLDSLNPFSRPIAKKFIQKSIEYRDAKRKY